MNVRIYCLVALAVSLGTSSVFAVAAPAINPTADAFVDSAAPGNNYGAAGALSIAAAGSAKGEFDSFVRFNFASTKTYLDNTYGAGNWMAQSITLQLTAANPNNALFNASAAGSFSIRLTQSNAWVEGTGSPNAPDTSATSVNFTNHANYLGSSDQGLGTYSFAGGTSGANTYTLQLSAGLISALQAGGDASLYLAANDNAVSYLFNSTNFGTVASRPTLVVNAVPEPSVMALLAAGGMVAGGFGLCRARRPVKG